MRQLALLVVLGWATPAAAQSTVSLSKPEASFPDPFTRLTAVRELPNGKVLVADVQDKVVQLLDLAGGTATKVGREGQGPGEYAMPAGLFPQPNGETWVNDVLGRRFLVIDPTGKPGKTIQLPSATGGFIGVGAGSAGVDASGRFYYQAPPFNLPAGGPPSGNFNAQSPDSLAILRWNGEASLDTVGWIVPPKSNIQSSGSGGGRRVSVTIGGGKVFTPTEAWGVAADGSIARVLPNPFRVVWYQPSGKAVAGPVIPYTPIKVTEADKKEVIEQRRRARPMAIRVGGGPGGGREASGGNVQLPEPEFEDTKPPFTGPNAVLVAPEGEVWVRRSQPAGSKNPVYEVYDRGGKLARRVTLNPNSSILGFGKGTVYVVRTDEDDLQYLERYRRASLAAEQ